MKSTFIRKDVLRSNEKGFIPVSITIERPVKSGGNMYATKVSFSDLSLYDANIIGVDEFHAVECAIAYADGVCKNSKNPEFFLTEGESLFRDDS